MSESGFLVSAILGAFGCYCAEGLNEGDVLGAVHYVGGEVFGDVHELGCFVGVKVGVYVRSLADRCSCRLDGVVEKVGALIVGEVVGFLDFSREIEAEELFEVLSVVGVGSFDGGEVHFFHFVVSFRVSLFLYIL